MNSFAMSYYALISESASSRHIMTTAYLRFKKLKYSLDLPEGHSVLLLACVMSQYCLLACVCCLSSSSVVVCNAAGGRPVAGRVGVRAGSSGRHCTAGQYGYVALGRHLVSDVLHVLD